MCTEKITPHEFKYTGMKPGYYIKTVALTDPPHNTAKNLVVSIGVGPFRNDQEAVWYTNTTPWGFVAGLSPSPDKFSVSGVGFEFTIVHVDGDKVSKLQKGEFFRS